MKTITVSLLSLSLLAAGEVTAANSQSGAISSALRKDLQTKAQDESGLNSNAVANPLNTKNPTGLSQSKPPGNPLGDGDDPGQSLMQMGGLDGVSGGATQSSNPNVSATMKINKEVKLQCQTPPYKMQRVEDLWFAQTEPCLTEAVNVNGTVKQRVTQIKGRWCFLDRTAGGGCGNPAFAAAWLPANGMALLVDQTVTMPTPPVIEGYGTTAQPGTILLKCEPGKTFCIAKYRDVMAMKLKADTMSQQGMKNQQASDQDSLVRGVQNNSANPIFRQGIADSKTGSGVDLDACLQNGMKGVMTPDGKMKTCNPDTNAQKEVISPVVSDSAGKIDCKDAISCIKQATTTSRWTETCESQIPLQLQQCETTVPIKQCKIYRPYDYTSCQSERKVQCKATGTVLGGSCAASVLTSPDITNGRLRWEGGMGNWNVAKRSTTLKVTGLNRIKSARVTRLGYDDFALLKINGVPVPALSRFLDVEYEYGYYVQGSGVDNYEFQRVGICRYFVDGCYLSGNTMVFANNTSFQGAWSGTVISAQGGWRPEYDEDIDLKPFLKEGDNDISFYAVNMWGPSFYRITMEFDENCVTCTDTVDRSACAAMDAAVTP